MLFYKSYAKLNLALNITGVLKNGYHTVDMIMQEISLHDTITIEKADAIRVECGNICDESQNTAYRAAQLFFAFTGIRGGARIQIEKHIPAQAGLGGGSSNAAAALAGLNQLYAARIPTSALKALALEIGMDVPFFIEGGCARAQGRGELLTPLPNRRPFDYLLIKPADGIDTARAYQMYDTAPRPPVNAEACAAALTAGNAREYFLHAGNALYPAASAIHPGIGHVIDACYARRASLAMMTGSGSCVFAIFKSKKALDSAYRYFSSQYPFTAIAQNMTRVLQQP